jgi:hypothetical protein
MLKERTKALNLYPFMRFARCLRTPRVSQAVSRNYSRALPRRIRYRECLSTLKRIACGTMPHKAVDSWKIFRSSKFLSVCQLGNVEPLEPPSREALEVLSPQREPFRQP